MSSVSSMTTSALNAYIQDRIANGTARSSTRDELIREGFVLKAAERPLTTDEVTAREAAALAALSTVKADDDPSNVLRTVVVSGRTVAEIYKNGAVAYYGDDEIAGVKRLLEKPEFFL